VFRYPGERSSSRPCRIAYFRQRSWALTLRSFHPACRCRVCFHTGGPTCRLPRIHLDIFVRGIGRQDLPIVTDRRLFTHENFKKRRTNQGCAVRLLGFIPASKPFAARSIGTSSRPFFVGSADPAMGFASFRFRGHRSMHPAGHDPERADGLRVRRARLRWAKRADHYPLMGFAKRQR